MDLAQKLTALRKRQGLTQAEAAEKINVSRQAVSKWEAGVGVPGVDSLKALSGLYHVSLDCLLDDGAALPGGAGEDRQRGRLASVEKAELENPLLADSGLSVLCAGSA